MAATVVLSELDGIFAQEDKQRMSFFGIKVFFFGEKALPVGQ